MNSNLFGAAAAVSLLLANGAQAQDSEYLGEIILGGGFTPVEEAAYGRAASVLTAQEIEDRGIATVQDALRAMPGVSINGSTDSFVQIRIRGGEGNHTLVLIDGIPAAGGDGEYILSGLETANIDRIEVLRGPQSVFYGANASSGVINIITRQGGIGNSGHVRIELGEGHAASASYSARSDRAGLAFALSRRDDDGYDVSGDGGDDDGIERTTLQLSGDYKATDRLSFGILLRRSEEDYTFDANSFSATDAAGYVIDSADFADRTETLGSIYAEYAGLDGRLMHRLSLEHTDNESSTNGGAPTQADRSSARYLLSYGLDGRAVAETDSLLNAILEWEEDSSSTAPDYQRERRSFALEYRGGLTPDFDVQAGLRYDDNDTFEDIVTWTLSGSYRLPSGVRLHASAGTGSVDPSYFELFANAFGFVGNPNLRPEQNESIDMGVEVPVLGGRGSVDVTLFRENLTDEITSVFDATTGTSTYINQAGTSKRKGVEVMGELAAGDTLDLRLAYTYLDATNPDGSVEIRRPEHELLLGATQQILNGRGAVSADLRYVAGNADTQFWGAFATVDLPDYVTVDLSGRYALNDRVTLTGRVTNLFDKDYSDVWGYAKRGRAIYVGLTSTF